MKLYTYDEVQKAQEIGSISDGIVVTSYTSEGKEFKEKKYKLVDIVIGKDTTIPYRNYADFKQIENLKTKIKSGIKLSPIVLRSYKFDREDALLDGWHRLNAYYELGITKIKAFRQIT